MKVIGIDPGISKMGWAILEVKNYDQITCIDADTVCTSPRDAIEFRLKHLVENFEKVVSLHKPTILGIEKLFVNKNPLSSIKLSHARGAILGSAGKIGMRVYEVAPNQVKKSLVGAGHASKDQVKFMVNLLIKNVLTSKADAIDAIAVAYNVVLIAQNNSLKARIPT